MGLDEAGRPPRSSDVAVYTDISDAELDSLLQRFDLGRALSFKGIAEGVENSNFLLETESGRFILTIYERRVREDELPFFIELMQYLSARGFPCPSPVADRDGICLQTIRSKPAALVTFLSGVSVRLPNAQHCREAGAGLARLHLASAGFAKRRRNHLGQRSWQGLFADQRDAAETLRPGLASEIDKDLAMLARDWPQDLPGGVIHADLFPDNVFFDGGRFAAAIDFYFACDDALAYDLAVCLNSWCFDAKGAFAPASARALISGYQSLRPLSASEKAGLPILIHGAAMRFFLTRLIDWGRADVGALVRPKDPSEYERKLRFHRGCGVDVRLFDPV